jgi:CRISPR type I-E-associated protein CasA/Cse1
MTLTEDWTGGKLMPMFRLDRQPWIPVMSADGVTTPVNLIQVFCDATRISGLAGSPLEVAAITRFLLTIVHLVETPTSLDAWGKLWQNRADLMSRCAQYIEAQAGVWDLFHEQHPFGQLPNLGKTLNPAHLLVYEAARKNNAVFADHSVVDAPVPIPAAALARGLIVTNAYAGSSGGGYRSGALAMRTVAMLCGRTLDETLLLDLLVQAGSPTYYDWKRYGHAVGHAASSVDIVQRYLWTARRVRLLPDASGTAAATMMLAPGDEMPESERPEDPMVVMRKDSKGATYVPLRLEAGRALWRSAHVLLNWHEDVKRLGAIDQLHRLVRRGFISGDQPVSMRVCGVAGEAQGPSSELWRDETLAFGLSVVSDDKRYSELVRAVSAAKEAASNTRKRIYSFAASYLQNGTDSTPDKDTVRRLSDELSPDLIDFWSVLAPVGERIACDGFDEVAWSSLLKKALEQTVRHAIDRLPADARRHRAEFARRAGGSAKQRKGATV